MNEQKRQRSWLPRTIFGRALLASLGLHGSLLAATALAPAPPAPQAPPLPIEVALGSAPMPAHPTAPATPSVKPVAQTTAIPKPRPEQLLTSHRDFATPDENIAEQPPQAVAQNVAAPPLTGNAPASPASGKTEGPTHAPDNLPYVRYGPPPPYPPEARQAGHEGKVRLKVLIAETGSVQEVLLIQGSGSASLDQAAVAALQTWRFAPAIRDGKPVSAWVAVPVVFTLR